MTFTGSSRKRWSSATLCAGFALVIGCGAPSDEAPEAGTEGEAYRGERGSPRAADRGRGAGKGASHGKGGKGQGKGDGPRHGHGKGHHHGPGHGHGHGHGHGPGHDCGHGSPGSGATGGMGSAGTTSSGGSGQAGSVGTAGAGGGSYGGGAGSFGTGGGAGGPGFGVCGDGLWGYPEQCDDGNVEPGDGCAPDCVLEAGYYCQYGGSCTLAECGDGVPQSYGDGNGGWAWEECDDANASSEDGCSASCELEPGFVCYEPGMPCHEVVCGDSLIDGYYLPDGSYFYEACDDGNDASGDGCSSECQLEQGHVCNEAGQPCREVECGDGFQDGYWVPGEGQGTGGSGWGGGGGGGPGGSWVYEACDDANTDSGDGCSSECVVEEGYICDQPGTPCRTPQCGDGFRDWVPGPDPGTGGSAGSGGVIFGGMGGSGGPGEPMHLEGCDDGNQDSGDGCSDECATEDGYVCPEPGLPCRIPACGDGITDWPYESCDDGNTTDGDYCSSTCQYEGSGSGGAAGSGGSTAGFGSGTGGAWGGGGWGGSG